jgi:hypothetical protein
MSDAPADLTAQPPGEMWPAAPAPSGDGWSGSKLIFFVALVLAAHFALIFIFGGKKPVAPRAVINVPQLQLADAADELVALDDPTLFALPHANDFATAFWQHPPVIPPPSFDWTEAPRYLPVAVQNLGAVFNAFMQTNPPVKFALDFKPPPAFAAFLPSAVLPPPPTSTLQITGDLAQRRWLNPFPLPSLSFDDVIAASRIQVLVDPAGTVISTVLLPAENSAEALGHWEEADQRAQALARTVRFAPAAQLTLGELIFNWRTVPTAATNSTATATP